MIVVLGSNRRAARDAGSAAHTEAEILRDPDAVRLAKLLGQLARQTPVSVGRYCDTGGSPTGSHRFVVQRLIRKCATGKPGYRRRRSGHRMMNDIQHLMQRMRLWLRDR
jgi:hypothetical protein